MKYTIQDVERAAKAAYEVNRTYCLMLGESPQESWEHAPMERRSSYIAGVESIIENPVMLDSEQHDEWLRHKTEEGWKYGPVKDEAKKEHPCIVPYHELPMWQKVKDSIFKSVIWGILNLDYNYLSKKMGEHLQESIAGETEISFHMDTANKDDDAIIRVTESGKVFVRGEEVDDNQIIYEAFKSFLMDGDLFQAGYRAAKLEFTGEKASD